MSDDAFRDDTDLDEEDEKEGSGFPDGDEEPTLDDLDDMADVGDTADWE